MLLGSNGGGGGLGWGPLPPCESATVLQTEARFISSHIKEAEVGRMEKITPTKQKQKMLIRLFTTRRQDLSGVLVLFHGFTEENRSSSDTENWPEPKTRQTGSDHFSPSIKPRSRTRI